MGKNKQKKTNMDEYFFSKYSRYVKNKERVNLFLTLKGCRTSCLIDIHKRYKNSFLRILHSYKMHFEFFEKQGDCDIVFLISNKPISTHMKETYSLQDYSENYFMTLGRFLEYPFPMNFRKKIKKENYGLVEFNFIPDKTVPFDIQLKKKENIYIYRLPFQKINDKLVNNNKNIVKKYKKCIQKSLGELFPNFSVELVMKMIV